MRSNGETFLLFMMERKRLKVWHQLGPLVRRNDLTQMIKLSDTRADQTAPSVNTQWADCNGPIHRQLTFMPLDIKHNDMCGAVSHATCVIRATMNQSVMTHTGKIHLPQPQKPSRRGNLRFQRAVTKHHEISTTGMYKFTVDEPTQDQQHRNVNFTVDKTSRMSCAHLHDLRSHFQ